MNKQELLEILNSYGFSKKILNAFRIVKREDFISEDLKEYAYINEPLPIGEGATISQPYTIAFMLDLLELKDDLKILEIGSGSGYVLALINEICKCNIFGVEIIKDLVDKSKKILSEEKNIRIINGNGFKGLKKFSKFDRILISAASDEIPSHLSLQLNINGILVCPVRNSIFKITKKNNKDYIVKEFPGFVFVPLHK